MEQTSDTPIKILGSHYFEPVRLAFASFLSRPQIHYLVSLDPTIIPAIIRCDKRGLSQSFDIPYPETFFIVVLDNKLKAYSSHHSSTRFKVSFAFANPRGETFTQEDIQRILSEQGSDALGNNSLGNSNLRIRKPISLALDNDTNYSERASLRDKRFSSLYTTNINLDSSLCTPTHYRDIPFDPSSDHTDIVIEAVNNFFTTRFINDGPTVTANLFSVRYLYSYFTAGPEATLESLRFKTTPPVDYLHPIPNDPYNRTFDFMSQQAEEYFSYLSALTPKDITAILKDGLDILHEVLNQ